MMIINPASVVRYPSYYNCKKSTLVTIISVDLMLIMVTILIVIIADRQQIPPKSSSSSFDNIDDLNTNNNDVITMDNNDSIFNCSMMSINNNNLNNNQQQQHDLVGIGLLDKKFAATELAVNIIWLLAGMLSLVAVITEHYHLTIICSLFGAFDVVSAFYFWTKTKSEENFLQMISSAIYFIFLLLFLSDLAYITKQRLRIARNRFFPPKLLYRI